MEEPLPLPTQHDANHELSTKLIYASTILHNYLVTHAEDAVEIDTANVSYGPNFLRRSKRIGARTARGHGSFTASTRPPSATTTQLWCVSGSAPQPFVTSSARACGGT